MSRRKTKCVAFEATSPAPHGPWQTYCGRVLAEDDATLSFDWPPDAATRPAGVCRRCWPKYRATFDAVRAVQLSPRPCRCVYVPRYDGPTFPTLRRPTDGVKP